jgi:hypothetical protein
VKWVVFEKMALLLPAVGPLRGQLAPSPSVVPYFTWTELNAGSGYSQSSKAEFRVFLREKYPSIDHLNRAWGCDYGSFDAIEPPPSHQQAVRKVASGLTYEFESFRRASFARLWKGVKGSLRQGNPEARLWLEGWGRFDYLPRHGMDQLALFDVADMAGVHTGSLGQPVQYAWQSALSRYSKTPIADGEINIYGSSFNGAASQDELRAAAEGHLFAQHAYGVRAFTFWNTQLSLSRAFSYSGPQLYVSSTDVPAPLSSSGPVIGLMRQKMDLYNPIIRNSSIVRSRVGILYSSTSHLSGWPYNEYEHEAMPIHAWLFESDYGYQFVHEDAVIDRREDFQGLDVLFVPWGIWLKADAERKLTQWVRDGGVLIASGPVGAFNEFGKPLGNLLRDAFGELEVTYGGNERAVTQLDANSIAKLRELGDLDTTHFGGWFWNLKLSHPRQEAKETLRLTDGTAVMLEAPLGSGRLIVAGGSIGKNAFRRFAMRQVEQRVTPLIQRNRNDGFHVISRIDRD